MPQILGKSVGATGYGLMGLTWRANPCSQSQAFDAMKTALATGANFWNGGEIYGPPTRNSLHLLNEYFTKYPSDAEKVVISIKGGANPETMAPDGSAKNTRRSVDECLRVLDGKKFLDIFECARVDPKTPIEETIETLAKYVEEGKIGGISLSECSEQSIRRAAKVTKIAAVELELSLFSTDILQNGIAAACGELGIPIVAYSPLGRGFLTGQLKSLKDIPADDGRIRGKFPQFQSGNFEENLKLVHEVEKIAEKKGCTAGQVAIAWVRAQSSKNGLPIIIPIPGATTVERVSENNKNLELSAGDIGEIEEILKNCVVKGGRYPPGFLTALEFGNSPPPKG